jgi:hypothetical protein
MNRIARSIVIALAALSIAAAPGNGPIASDWHQGGHLYLLLKNGSVAILDEITKRRLGGISAIFAFEPVEIFSARLQDREYVFVSGFSGRAGAIYQYTAEGKLLAKFDTPEQAASFDVDPERHLLYVASPVTNVIYAINVDKKGAAKRLAYIRDAAALGPVIYDPGRNRVLLGDTGRGVLYEIDATTGFYREIASNLGHPISLGIGPMSRRLFVADSMTGLIHVLRLDNGDFKYSEAINTGLRSLSAITMGPNESLLIADGYGAYQMPLSTKKLTRYAY